MKIFGKSLSEYISFQKVLLALVVVVGLFRLGLSLDGLPDSKIKWISLTAVFIIGAFYYAIRVYTTGFGSYRHLLPLIFIQNLLTQIIVVAGIGISIFTNKDNIFSIPEFSPPFATGRSFGHILGHLTVGLIIPTIIAWLICMLIMFVTSKIIPVRGKSGAVRA